MRQGWKPPPTPLPPGAPPGAPPELVAAYVQARDATTLMTAAAAAGEPAPPDAIEKLMVANQVISKRDRFFAAAGSGVTAAGAEAAGSGEPTSRLVAACGEAFLLADTARRSARQQEEELAELLEERQARVGRPLHAAAAALASLQAQERALQRRLMAGSMPKPELPTSPHGLARLPPELVLRILRLAAYPLSAWVAAEDCGLGGDGPAGSGGGSVGGAGSSP